MDGLSNSFYEDVNLLPKNVESGGNNLIGEREAKQSVYLD